jgi:hypothetical protein
MPYGEAVIDGIRGARVMVLVFSAHANTSEHIQKEVERAVNNPIVGEWTWTAGAPVAIRANHTFGTGPLEGMWRSVPGKNRTYRLTWPSPTDQVTLSPDGRSLAGMNQYGILVSGTRSGGGTSLAGEWRWSIGVPVTIRPDGSAQAGTFLARWEPVNPAARTYRITWPPAIDELVLGPDGNRLQGGNQYGFKVDAPRR